MNTEQKAKQFNSLLLEHDKLTREVSLIESNFNLTPEDHKKIKQLKEEMMKIQRQAATLGTLWFDSLKKVSYLCNVLWNYGGDRNWLAKFDNVKACRDLLGGS